MSSTGHALDAINRIKYNASIKKKRIDRITKLRDLYLEEVNKNRLTVFSSTTVSKDVLEKIKLKIRTDIKQKQRRKIVKSIITTILVVLIIVFGFRYFISK